MNLAQIGYIKRLQEENKSLQMLSCVNCGEKYLSPAGAELYEKNVQLQEENEELRQVRKNSPDIQEPYVYLYRQIKKQCYRLEEKIKSEKYIKENALQEATKYSMKCGEFRQALEEIRGISKQCMTKDLCSVDCDYADRCYIEDEEVPAYDICKLIIEKINEALNDRD